MHQLSVPPALLPPGTVVPADKRSDSRRNLVKGGRAYAPSPFGHMLESRPLVVRDGHGRAYADPHFPPTPLGVADTRSLV